MKVLFVGGSGQISSACTQLAVEQGIDLYLLNRGKTDLRPIPPQVNILSGDIRDISAAKKVLSGHTFDVVVNWINYNPEHIQADLEIFSQRCGQYIFISSASAYQKPLSSLPITESTPLHNPYWAYSRAKIDCEELLMKTYRATGFPVTIVRPSHTYDQTKLPVFFGYTTVQRMKQGKKIIIHGDGSSLWVLTHHRDFAKGFNGLLGNDCAIGESFHITSDETLSWNQINQIVAKAAGLKANIIHIPSDFINAFDPEWGATLLGDKTHSLIFDNSKIKRFVPGFKATIPYSVGAKEAMAWFNADPARQVINEKMDQMMDRIISAYEMAMPTR